MAHELNNRLAAVMGNLEMIADDLAELSPAEADREKLARIEEAVSDAREAAERMRSIILGSPPAG